MYSILSKINNNDTIDSVDSSNISVSSDSSESIARSDSSNSSDSIVVLPFCHISSGITTLVGETLMRSYYKACLLVYSKKNYVVERTQFLK